MRQGRSGLNCGIGIPEWGASRCRAKPVVKSVKLSDDGLSATVILETLTPGYVYEFDLGAVRSRDKVELLHRNAYCTVNEVPAAK